MAMILSQACGSQLAGDGDIQGTHLPRLARRLAGKRAPTSPVSSLGGSCWRWRYSGHPSAASGLTSRGQARSYKSCLRPVGASLLAMTMFRTPICRAWHDASRASALLQVLSQACGSQLAGDGDVRDTHLPRLARRLAGKRAPTKYGASAYNAFSKIFELRW